QDSSQRDSTRTNADSADLRGSDLRKSAESAQSVWNSFLGSVLSSTQLRTEMHPFTRWSCRCKVEGVEEVQLLQLLQLFIGIRTGIRTRNVVPCPGADSKSIDPPRSATILWLTNSPSPVPFLWSYSKAGRFSRDLPVGCLAHCRLQTPRYGHRPGVS